MIGWILKKLFGSKNARMVKSLRPVVAKINELEIQFRALSDDALREKVGGWKADIKDKPWEEQQAYLDRILPEAFAAVKNAAWRLTERKHTFTVCGQPMTWAMVHFDVQLIGGICLHRGCIGEMATGEGKTLVATLPLFLNALTGRGAHLVTTNDYLARRDGEWMGALFNFLGLTVGIIQHDQYPDLRREQYNCDITYGMNSEFGFDYLRDNGMATSKETQVQRGYAFAIVDEVDSILIDEARVPLIISGPVTVSTHQFDKYKPMVEQIVKKQTMLCNRLASEALQLFEQGRTGGTKEEQAKMDEAARTMCKVKWGQPLNKGYLRAMEDPDKRRAIEKMELSFYTDVRKEEMWKLKEELFFTIDQRAHEADLTEQGRQFMSPGDPEAFVLPDLITQFAEIDQSTKLTDAEKVEKKAKAQEHMNVQGERIHNISSLLRAYCLYEKDVNYIIQDGKVVIVDENTGRTMPGRRWSDGLHQAVEAKEGVTIDKETQTLATITVQNYFRLYRKLSGMTGTAETEANEFSDIYKLDVAVIPTNRPNVRKDANDLIFKTRREKYGAVIKEIGDAHAKGQPVLVGTASVEASELVSKMLQRAKIPHTVLNARHNQQEAEIIARAGQLGAVTISTNMAGRGTDIKLGPGATEAGGLYVLGTERHESRRIDRQLRGRGARQGDPGYSRFFVSFEDDLMRNFGAAERMTKLMERFGMKEGEALEHSWLNKSVETAQKRVESRNYLIRKRTLDFDDVMNRQREVVYGLRNEAINSDDPRALLWDVIDDRIPEKCEEFFPEGEPPQLDALAAWANVTFPVAVEKAALEGKSAEDASAFIADRVKKAYELKSQHEVPDAIKSLERYITLTAIDKLWQEHLYAMDGLREGVYLRAYGQKDPLIEYKQEAFKMFTLLMGSIKDEVLHNLFRSTSNIMAFEQFLANLPQYLSAPDENAISGGMGAPEQPPPQPQPEDDIKIEPARREAPKVGRNEPCPCGSGRKYKDCCGKPK
jgi:preprotein translocase subunit SecA